MVIYFRASVLIPKVQLFTALQLYEAGTETTALLQKIMKEPKADKMSIIYLTVIIV